MRKPGDIETIEVGAACTANRVLEDLPRHIEQLVSMINEKVVPQGHIEILLRARGPHRAIRGKGGNVLEAGYDDDGETWIEVGT